jgi:hypothetical protein
MRSSMCWNSFASIAVNSSFKGKKNQARKELPMQVTISRGHRRSVNNPGPESSK